MADSRIEPSSQPDHLPAGPHRFAAIVRHCRDERGLNQAEFAALFDGGVNQQAISKWETGRLGLSPRRNALLRLAEICGHSPGALLDALGYWGSDGPDPGIASPDDPLLDELNRMARGLPPHQLRTVIDVVRAMRRD